MTTKDELSVRLENLERHNRQWRRLAVACMILWAALFTMAQLRASRPLEAGKFLLVDAKGKKRAEFGLFLDQPGLVFYDESGAAVLKIGLGKGEPAITIADPASGRYAALSTVAGSPQFSFHGAGGSRRLWIGLAGETPAMGLVGPDGAARAALGLTGSGNPYLHLFGKREHGGLQLAVADEMTVLRFLDASDRPRTVLGMLENEKSAGLTFYDPAGAARAILMLSPAGAGLEFLDQGKDRIWHAP